MTRLVAGFVLVPKIKRARIFSIVQLLQVAYKDDDTKRNDIYHPNVHSIPRFSGILDRLRCNNEARRKRNSFIHRDNQNDVWHKLYTEQPFDNSQNKLFRMIVCMQVCAGANQEEVSVTKQSCSEAFAAT